MSTPFLNFSRIICTNFRQGHASGFWGAGLCGWNCRHTFFAVFPELGDPPAWTEESLQELNARNIEYNGKKYTQYEISQMQRARERERPPLEKTVNPLHFRDIHNTRGLYALDILLRLGKCCTDLCAFFLGNIHNNHHFTLKWVAKWVRANETAPGNLRF